MVKVVFLEDDRIEAVSDGYARNYLFPKKLAVIATPAVVAQVEKRKEQKQTEIEMQKAKMQALADKLAEIEVEIKVDAGEGGKLFGSVTSTAIAQELKASAGIDIDKRNILLGESIKLLGEYKVKIKLHREVTAPLKVKISQR